jgi:glycosyltransferase involved in cell wall biosynthesis
MAMNETGAVQPVKLLVSKLMHFLGIACSTHSIAVSRQLDRELKQILRQFLLLPYWINKHKLRVIYNGIELERFWRHSLPSRDAREEIMVGFVGRLDPKKGVEDLIEAVTELIRRGNRLKLRIVGTGWYREKLEPLVASAGMGEHITFLGHRSDVMIVARDFDIFVLPSLSEGLPISIIEMMATGLPIVATNVGGIPEQVEDGVNGFLIAPRDPLALAHAIGRLYAEPALRLAFARSGQTRARALFDARTMLEATEAAYSS